MKPHPRIRKTIKWGGAAVTVLLVVAWVGSGWWHGAWFKDDGGSIDVGSGRVSVGNRPLFGWLTSDGHTVKVAPGIRVISPPRGWRLAFERRDWPSEQRVWIPLWCPTLVSLLVTVAAWRLDTLARRRARLNLCPKCNYDRTGLAKDAVCPECGSKGGQA